MFKVTAPVTPSRYVPPSKRAEEPATLSTTDMKSDKLFPTLAPMKPTMNGASWGQIRARLATPTKPEQPPQLDFKRTIEASIQRMDKEQEEGKRRENITNPVEMTPAQLEQNGWTSLKLAPPNPYYERFTLEEDDYYNARTAWPTEGFPFECVHVGGAEIERSLGRPTDYFAQANEGLGDMPPMNVATEMNARNRLLAFVGVGKISNT